MAQPWSFGIGIPREDLMSSPRPLGSDLGFVVLSRAQKVQSAIRAAFGSCAFVKRLPALAPTPARGKLAMAGSEPSVIRAARGHLRLRCQEADLEIRRLHRQQQRRNQVPPATWAAAQHLALAIDDGCATAVQYLRRWPADEENLRCAVARLTAWRREVDDATLSAALERPLPRRAARAASAADAFLREQQLHEWVRRQNIGHGVAPMTGVLLRAIRSARASNGAVGVAGRPAATKKVDFQWLRRWRRRWRVTLGRIPCRDEVPPADRRAKAHPEGPKSPPAIRPPAQKWVHIAAPFLGPPIPTTTGGVQKTAPIFSQRTKKNAPKTTDTAPQGDRHVALEPDVAQGRAA